MNGAFLRENVNIAKKINNNIQNIRLGRVKMLNKEYFLTLKNTNEDIIEIKEKERTPNSVEV